MEHIPDDSVSKSCDTAISIRSVELPPSLARRLPTRPIGATLIGMMGRDLSLRGKNIGEMLLMNALHKAWQASKLVSCWAVVVDAKAGARDFYIRYDFTPFVTQLDRLFLPMKKIDLLFESESEPVAGASGAGQ